MNSVVLLIHFKDFNLGILAAKVDLLFTNLGILVVSMYVLVDNLAILVAYFGMVVFITELLVLLISFMEAPDLDKRD